MVATSKNVAKDLARTGSAGPIYKEKPVYRTPKRLKRTVKRLFGMWRRKNYDIRFLLVNGYPHYKKVTFQSTVHASQAHAELSKFGHNGYFPELIKIDNNELTVKFVNGDPVKEVDHCLLDKLADFYAFIYKRGAHLQPLQSTIFWRRFENNLLELRLLKVLTPEVSEQLSVRARALAPEEVWLGFDYTDPIESNLLVSESTGKICAIDIKNLQSGALIGQGIAKARKHWLNQDRLQEFFARLRAHGAPDLESYFEFIQIFDKAERLTKKLTAEAALKYSSKLRALRKNKLSMSSF